MLLFASNSAAVNPPHDLDEESVIKLCNNVRDVYSMMILIIIIIVASMLDNLNLLAAFASSTRALEARYTLSLHTLGEPPAKTCVTC
jgi:hypothetical protein